MMPTRPSRDGVKPPSKGTLTKYGLTEAEWWRMAAGCNYTCVICGKPFADRRLAIDHEHVKGWRARKRKLKSGKRRAKKDQRVMTAQERKRYVRGVVHNFCNTYVRFWMTLERVTAIRDYLQAYHDRESKDDNGTDLASCRLDVGVQPTGHKRPER